ncbi:MAG: alpha-hydroxy-acid oxidizing protein, partial [Actinobacteria bacterium]|nr:alpha-hydroxy-acid oxidizing protein [Actinomycetota bacterium]
ALEPLWRDYVGGGAGAERTLRANVDAFGAWQLRQRVLCGLERVDESVTVLGHELPTPIVVAPVAYQRLLHPDGEEGMARAAEAAGAALCLSTFATATPAEVAAAAPDATRFLQVYVFRDRGVTDELIDRALAAGCTALFLTVDLPVVGHRDRELRHGWQLPVVDLPAIQFALGRGVTPVRGLEVVDPALDWPYLERLASRVQVPVVVKGVLEAGDALRAAEHGAAGVVVSNHGGRQLDGARPTLEALPEIAEALAGRLDVFFDGGIRRGSDVAVALALGARAVLVGRLPVWGLSAGGEAGALRVLELLRSELAVTLHLMGCASARELGSGHVRRALV